ncbi:MAG: hypothetical protein IH591_16145 [Bacteroidales bacterium]|nr:hypothetical protein [Bacteroidales bacterium]
MLRFFKGTGPGVIMLFLLTAGLLWFNSFREPMPPGLTAGYQHMILFHLVQKFAGNHYLAATITAFILLLVLSGIIINFNTRTFFINERTFLPGVLYLILTSILPVWQNLNPLIPASIFLFLAVVRITGTYRRGGVAYSFYDAALMISIGSLFYTNLIWYGILLFIGMLLLRTFDLREVAISLLGLITPYVFVFGIYYIADLDMGELTTTISSGLFGQSPDMEWSRFFIVTGAFIVVTLLTASVHLMSVFTTKKVKSRKVFSLQIWMAVVTIVLFFVSPSASDELIYILAMPASYILSHYYINIRRKKIVPEIMFTGTLLLAVLLHFFEI